MTPETADFTSERTELAPAGGMEGETRRSKRRSESRKVRAALHRALAEIEAIGSEPPNDESARRLWRRLASGGWSLVTEFELDGRRYYLINHDRSAAKRRDALTHRERRVFHFVELGLSNKSIAFALGVSPSTVATRLHNARNKIRRSFRMDLTSRLEREAKKRKGNRHDPSR